MARSETTSARKASQSAVSASILAAGLVVVVAFVILREPSVQDEGINQPPLHEILDMADKNKDGHLDVNELKALQDEIPEINSETGDMSVDLDLGDVNNNGKLDLEDIEFHIKRWVFGSVTACFMIGLLVYAFLNESHQDSDAVQFYTAREQYPRRFHMKLAEKHTSAAEAINKKQMKLGLHVHAVSKAERKHLRSVFTTLDVNHDGFLKLEELKQFCDSMNNEQVEGLFRQMVASLNQMSYVQKDEPNEKSRVELGEFMAFWESVVGKVDWSVVKEELQKLVMKKVSPAENVDDTLDKEALLRELEPSWQRKGRLLFHKIDTNEDGKLTREEFTEWASANQEMAKVFIPGLHIDAGLDDLCESFDANGDGSFNVEEFQSAYVMSMRLSYMTTD